MKVNIKVWGGYKVKKTIRDKTASKTFTVGLHIISYSGYFK